jgi:uncharacterized protein YoaH (UPF0181 family)
LAGYGACPPGFFAPGTPAVIIKEVLKQVETTPTVTAVGTKLLGYNAYGAPVVLHDSGANMSMAGGIFPRGAGMEGYDGYNGIGALDANDADVKKYMDQGMSLIQAIAEVAKNLTQGGKRAEEQKAAAKEDEGIYGIPTPVAVGAGLLVAYLAFFKSRKNPRHGKKRR